MTRWGVGLLLLQFSLSSTFVYSQDKPGKPPGDQPKPRPSDPPKPTPDPNPPGRTPDVNGARAAGRQDGNPDGSREGNERGQTEGMHNGQQHGYRDGYERCEREERRRWYDSGYGRGFRVGERDGEEAGDQTGRQEGQSRGNIDGYNEGQRLADQEAHRVATPLGVAQGESDANQSDARDRGGADGTSAGDQWARDKAREIDYPRGRSDYRREREAEPIESQDEFSQRTQNLAPRSFGAQVSPMAQLETLLSGGSPDFRYSNPRRSYPSPEENAAYQGAYREGYTQGFSSTYQRTYDNAYRNGQTQGQQRGCDEARRRQYQDSYDSGYLQGRNDGYRRAYDSNYQRAYRYAYDAAFPLARDQAYQATYPVAYQRHFDAARASGYQRKYGELYQGAFDVAKQARFDAVYSTYAQEEYTRGRSDEAERFRLEPLSLTLVEPTETIANGLFEPDEVLRLRLKLRNFDEAIDGRDVKLVLQALDDGRAVLSQGEATLVQSLKRKSMTTVSNALEFRMNEAAAGKASRFRFQVVFQGRVISSQDLQVRTQFMVGISFADRPVFQEGIETRVRVRFKNQSQAPVEGGKVQFLSRPDMLEVRDGELAIPNLGPGEERTLEFRVVAKVSRDSVFPFAFVASLPSGRRVGVLDLTLEAPVLNDYRIQFQTDLGALRKTGVARAEYVIKNVNARLLLRSLQLHIRVKDTDGNLTQDQLVVIGPNPQYLTPLLRGQQHNFVVPFYVRLANGGGQLELEVKEDGKTVVIHQKGF